MARRAGPAVVLALALVGMLGCQQGEEAGPADGSTTSTSATSAPAAAPSEPRVTIRNNLYEPAAVDVPVGGKVVWVFDDGTVPHTVTSDTNAFGSPPSGQTTGTFERVFPEAGTFIYHCDFHPTMTGTVAVR